MQNNNNVIYVDSFDVEHIRKEIRAFVINIDNNKNIITNMFRIQAHDSIMCRFKMKSSCSKCRKDTENINPRALNKSNNRTMVLWYYKNVQYVEVKNQDLLKTEKQKDC